MRARKTILLVDDETRVLEGLRRGLQNEPYRILCARNSREALEILAEEIVHVVVSDEQMPGMSGSEFLSKVRENFPHTVRIMLTGQASTASAMRAIYDGYVYQYLHKPCKVADLASIIYNALLLKSLQLEGDDPHLRMSSKQQEELLTEVAVPDDPAE